MEKRIRKAEEKDADGIWEIIHPIIEQGETYTFDPLSGKEEMLGFWLSAKNHTYVYEENGNILGTFFIRENQPGLGKHIANAGYMVSPDARGKGIGRKMAEFSLGEAKRLGFGAMQFNFVVKSNENAIKLWKALGFEVIGEIPDAFRHKRLGFVNALIMYRKL